MINSVAMTIVSSSTFRYVWDVDAGGDLSSGSYTATVSGVDLNGRAYAGTESITFTIDLTGPKVTSLTTSTTNGVYTDDDVNPSNSDTISFTVNFDEPVTITGSPRIPLSNITDANGNPVYATYVSGSGTASPTFVYTVKELSLIHI